MNDKKDTSTSGDAPTELTEADMLEVLGTITEGTPKRLPPGWAKFARGIERKVLARIERAADPATASGDLPPPWNERMGVKVGEMVWPGEAFPHMKAELLEWRARAAVSADAVVEARLHNVWNDALEEAALICEQQASEPECPERASHCADEIRALKSSGVLRTGEGEGK